MNIAFLRKPCSRAFCCVVVLLGSVSSRADDCVTSDATYAVVDGHPIKASEICSKVAIDLEELEDQSYDIKRRQADELILQHILEAEATKRNKSVDELMSQFDALRDRPVTKQEVEAFARERNIDLKRLKKAERASIPNIIQMNSVYTARQEYQASLRRAARVAYLIPKRPRERKDVSTGLAAPLGDPSAPVAIVVFSDFQCPFSERAARRIGDIRQQYGDKVKVYFRHFPLEQIHPDARIAARASICAREQGRFWEYHDLLFANSSKLDEASLLKYAKASKFEPKAFKQCLSSEKADREVDTDQAEGLTLGVNSTPTFFVNGYVLRGAVPMENFARIIDDELSDPGYAVIVDEAAGRGVPTSTPARPEHPRDTFK